jgi:polyhydroxyalkanoate synthesis regulator phasin
MVDNPDWRQLLETGRQFTAMTRAEAQQRAQDLVREGQLAQEKMQAFVDDLVRTSRRHADELLEVVRNEVRRQLETLGVKPPRTPAKKKATKKKATKKAAKKKAAKKSATKKKSAAKKKAAKGGAKKAAKKSAGARKPSGST